MKGKVYIIGAGPGDIGLLTVKGLKCLQNAHVVVYDFHLNAQVLNYINHFAEFIYAGKRGGLHEMSQSEINQLLIEKAKQGKTVCRLKGGDPFVFGRGGEEAEALYREGIEFEIIPGVSSAIAAPAYAGIPLTHRLYSSSFAVVPGYEDTSKQESSINWEKLATGVGTIVFLMTVKNIHMVCEKLIKNGRSPDTPTAVIRWGTRAEQKTIVGNLKNIPELVKEEDIKPPAVMVVGDVVKLRESLKWYEEKPLFGQRILVTTQHSEDFAILEELGAEIMEFPTVEIVPPGDWRELDDAIERIGLYHWIIFTSGNGIRYFFKRFFELNKDIRDLKGIKFCAIGAKTAEEIKKYGIKVDLIPDEFNAEGLVKAISQRLSVNSLQGMRFLLPRAKIAREILPEKIRELGGEIDVVTAYRILKPETCGKRLRRFLKEGRVSIATFTSAGAFNNFMEIIGGDAHKLFQGVAIAVIGPVTRKAVEETGLEVNIMPRRATTEALVEEVIKWAKNRKLHDKK